MVSTYKPALFASPYLDPSEGWSDDSVVEIMVEQIERYTQSKFLRHDRKIFQVGPWFGNFVGLLSHLGIATLIHFGRRGLVRAYQNRVDLPSNVLVKSSPNGYVMLCPQSGLVIRAGRVGFENPSAAALSVEASLLYPGIAPQIVYQDIDQGFEFWIEPFFQTVKRLTWRHWRDSLSVVTSDLLRASASHVRFGGTASPHAVWSEIQALSAEPPSGFSDLDKQFGVVVKALEEVHRASKVSMGARPGKPLPFRFAHGDLTPSNVVLSERGRTLVDWSNGGWSNFAYDLMINAIYHPERGDFRLISGMSIRELEVQEVFQGQLPAYGAWYREVTGTDLDNETLRVAVAFACADFAVKRYRRYRSLAWNREGGEVLSLASRALWNLAGSRRANE